MFRHFHGAERLSPEAALLLSLVVEDRFLLFPSAAERAEHAGVVLAEKFAAL